MTETEIEKAHKYSRKEFRNGRYYYYYDRHNNFGRIVRCQSSPIVFRIDRSLGKKKQCEQVVRQSVDYIKNVWIEDWKKNKPSDKSICRELRNKRIVFDSISFKHIGHRGGNSAAGRKDRNLKNLLDHVKYLPCAKELLESSGVWTHSRYEPAKQPFRDSTKKIVAGYVYQTITGEAPEGDIYKYVQTTVSKTKYTDGTYGNAVYLSVVGVNKIKKSTDFPRYVSKFEIRESCIPGQLGSWHHHSRNTPVNKKSVNINIAHITEGNRGAKYAQLEKCLNGEQPVFVPADNTRKLPDVRIRLKDWSDERVEKALRTMAMTFDVPLKAAKGEVFLYRAQEDLTNRWCGFFSDFVRKTYDFVTGYFALPEKTVMSKAENLVYKGRALYYPETGEPIKRKDWLKFVETLEKFLNRNTKDAGRKIILESKSLAKILDRMLKYNTLDLVTKTKLEDIRYRGKTFDWISDNVKNMRNVFGETMNRKEQARIEVLTQSAAQKITNVSEKMQGDIRQILIDGVRSRKSKGQVSQDLFDRMVGDNRDYQRLADTEIQNAFNGAFIREEVYGAPEGEKVYFQRLEVIDGNTCRHCREMNGKVAVWSETPLDGEKIKDPVADYAIWEGKEWSGGGQTLAMGVLHPYCRGSWVRYDREGAKLDALIAEKSNRAKKWNSAVARAKEEFKEKGIMNPNDTTKGYTERINELFNSGD